MTLTFHNSLIYYSRIYYSLSLHYLLSMDSSQSISALITQLTTLPSLLSSLTRQKRISLLKEITALVDKNIALQRDVISAIPTLVNIIAPSEKYYDEEDGLLAAGLLLRVALIGIYLCYSLINNEKNKLMMPILKVY